jgi:DNA-binding XRE family transcriptional regulator
VAKDRTYNYDELLAKQMRNKAFREAYQELEGEYELAKQVMRLRISAHLTQAQLAARAGTSQPAIARLESGNHRNMTLGFINRVAHALEAVPEVRLKKHRVGKARVRQRA